jgi:hypothetical protein
MVSSRLIPFSRTTTFVTTIVSPPVVLTVPEYVPSDRRVNSTDLTWCLPCSLIASVSLRSTSALARRPVVSPAAG